VASTWAGSLDELDMVQTQLDKAKNAPIDAETAQSLSDLRDFVQRSCVDLSEAQFREGLATQALGVLKAINSLDAVKQVDQHNRRDTELLSTAFEGLIEKGRS
jgi:hypothetical protein